MFSYFVFVAALVVGAQAAAFSSNARIINGQVAPPNQFPWHAIVQGTELNSQQTLCGGALISNTFVLTAAHCIFGNNFLFFNVGLGTNNLSRPLVSFEINPNINNNRITHPQYNANTNVNDIGLLRLPLMIPPQLFSITPIRLPAQSQFNTPFTNVTATFTGFGRVANIGGLSQALRFTETRVILQSQCSQIYGNAVANANTLCTVGREFDVQGACANDNGGPLVLFEGFNVPTLIGVQSFLSQAGCVAGQPVGYVRLAAFTTWISQNTGIPVRN